MNTSKLFAVVPLCVACGAPPTRVIEPAKPDTPSPNTAMPDAIYDAFVARELAAVMAAKSPLDHAAIATTVFVFLNEPSTIDDRATAQWIVARDAVFDVADDGHMTAEPFTALPPDGHGLDWLVGNKSERLGKLGRWSDPPILVIEGDRRMFVPTPASQHAVVLP